MSLCSRCSSISLHNLAQDLPRQMSIQCGGRRGMVMLKNGADLAHSALECPLCEIIQEILLQSLQKTPTEIVNGPTPQLSDTIIIEPKADPLGVTFPETPTEGSYLTGFEVTATEGVTRKLLKAKVRLYTDGQDRDSFHKHHIIGRAQLSDPACDAGFSLIKRWINACQQGHAPCRETLSGHLVDESSPPELPTRVLHVQDNSVKLFQSEGYRGRYATLSHCWGPPDKQPLRTMKVNLQSHIQEIPWSSLPKTFQDAITVVRKIRFHYIWIDSLCIIQDDQDDWLRESRMMGSIYERAELTIAASHTSDSQEGFLLPRPPLPPSIELPNFFPQNTAAQNPRVFATIRRDAVTDTFPEHGALNRRAWATQEWLLSRRMVFFTKSVIIWSCKVITQRETGEKCYSISRNVRWKNVVESYSERQLTFATDKLIALEGLRTEMGRRSGYEYAYGVWRESLPDQLLWQVTQGVKAKAMINSLGLPTWTWAHVPCGIRFLSIKGGKNLCESIVYSDDGKQMTIRARAKRITAIGATLDARRGDPVMKAIQADMSASHVKLTSSMAQYILDHTGSVVGWVILDQEGQDVTGRSVSCLSLMGGVGRREEEAERRMGLVISTKLRHYWVLVVRHREDGTYARVGVGKTYGREWWSDAAVEALTLS